MPITGPIPLPGTGMDSFLESLKTTAEARKASAQASLPFGGANVPGPAGQIVGLEMVRQMYGDNSPQYKQAKSAFDLNQQSTQSRVNYQNILANTADKRFSTPLAKTVQEFEDIKNGNLPGTKTPMSDEQKQQYQGMYGLDLVKKTTDTDTRKKDLYSHNIDITLSKINPQALTQFSGVKGGVQLLNEIKNSQIGKASPQYKAYEQSLTNAKLLAKQVRQFYGDSITPSVQEGLKSLTNPSTWLKSPEIAMQNFNSFVDTLKSESKTYQQATESPDVYSGNAPSAQQGEQQAPQQGASSVGVTSVPGQPDQQSQSQMPPVQGQPKMTEKGLVVLYKDGQEYHLPPEMMRQALKEGATLEP